jgi:hypothetical protein
MRGKVTLITALTGVVSLLMSGPVSQAFSGAGAGTQEDPYIITNVNQLQEMNDNLGAWYELGNDIDASPTKNWNEDPQNPGIYFGFVPIYSFRGYFDGKEHTITGLYITSRNFSNFIGLFGAAGLGSVIKNVGLVNVNVNAPNGNYVGGLAGSNNGTITKSYSTGSVPGRYAFGGLLVGYNTRNATITNCYSTGSATGDFYVGGLVGFNDGTIINCYSRGSVTGIWYVGGLVGWNPYGTITNCYSTGVVSGDDFAGGLVGQSLGRVVDSFWDIQTSGQTSSAGGTGKTTAQMKTLSTFTNAGWDFVNTWWVPPGDYPSLIGVGEAPPGETPKFLTLPFNDPDVMVGWIFDATSQPYHYGIDFIEGSSIGDSDTWQSFDIVASADGEAFWNQEKNWGMYVFIRHYETDAKGISYYTLYSHLSSVNPKIPKESDGTYIIKRGEFVGKAGDTGSPDLVHLHFEVHKGDARSIDNLPNRLDPYDLNQDRDSHYGEKAGSIRPGGNYLWTTDPPIIADTIVAKLHSPAELRVYDSQGRITGLQDGQEKNEIPYSTYFENTVTIFVPADAYSYKVGGTQQGTYGLHITLVEGGGATTFAAIDIPTSAGAVHDYLIDWDALSAGDKGVVLKVDAEGDGTFEQTIPAGGVLENPQISVNNLVNISCGRVGYDRRTGQFSVDVTVKNTSVTVIASPVWFVIETISSPAVTLAGSDGTTVDGKPYMDLSGLLGNGQLDAGETISKRIYFNNPNRVQFTFKPSVRGIILP